MRTFFIGYVNDKTEEEVMARIGRTDSVDAGTRNMPNWIYTTKASDPDNRNRVDNESILVFRRDASGKSECTTVVLRLSGTGPSRSA